MYVKPSEAKAGQGVRPLRGFGGGCPQGFNLLTLSLFKN